MQRYLWVLLWMQPWLIGCSTLQNDIETARFHLDKGQYSDAITILEPLVEDDPTNFEVVSLAAEAYFGRGFLGESGSYLGVLSRYLAGQEAGNTNMQSIENATPAAAADGKTDIFLADDLLRTIPDASKTQENFLQAAFSDLALISVIGVATVGALDTEDPCELNFAVITSDESSRFDRALDEVGTHFEGAGIEFAGTELANQLTQMQTDLDGALDLATYLETEFEATLCP